MCILCGSTAQSIADVGASSAPSFARGHAKRHDVEGALLAADGGYERSIGADSDRT